MVTPRMDGESRCGGGPPAGGNAVRSGRGRSRGHSRQQRPVRAGPRNCSPRSRSGAHRRAADKASRETQGAAKWSIIGGSSCCSSRAGGHKESRCRAGRAGICGRSPTACRSRWPRRRPPSGRPPGRRRADKECRVRARSSDGRRRIDQPAIGRNPGDGDEFDALVDHALERVDVELAAGIARHDLDDRACALGDLKECDIVGGVFRLGGQDAVALRETAAHRTPSARRRSRSP